METNKILGADLLDIIFDGKNKEYGAYELRKTYSQRLTRALLGTGALLFFLCGGYFLSGLRAATVPWHADPPDVTLVKIPDNKVDPLPVPPPKPQAVQIKTAAFTTIRIVKEVKPDEHPPTQDDLVNTKIGTVNVNGLDDPNITAPPSDGDRGVVVAPAKDEYSDQPFMKVEKESEYPGGLQAWRRYLGKNLVAPDEAVNKGISGTVVIQFIVDRDGTVSGVHAISGPEEGGLREAAIKVIRKSGKWVPAIQNGRPVKSYKSQPIVFQIDTQ
ncbi:MAG: energy transducer TonB [Bacteroidota bacterium]|nr:energy transducer TonB [Bacteroidota bacterium]